MRVLSSLFLTICLLLPVCAEDTIPEAVVAAVRADITRRGLPDATDTTFAEQRFERADGKTLSPSGEELHVLRGVEELGGGFAFIGLDSGDYWSLCRSPSGEPIMNGPYRWRVEVEAPVAPPVTAAIEWPPEPGNEERATLLEELAGDVEPERRRQIAQAVLVSPRSWELVEEQLNGMTATGGEGAELRAASVRRKLRREVRQLLQLKLAGEVGGGFYDGQFAEFARYGDAGRRSLVRILSDGGEDGDVRGYAAQALGELGDASTVTELNDILESQGRRLGSLSSNIVYALAKLGDRSHIEPIIDRLQKSIKSSPGEARNYSQLAHIYVRLGDRRAALEQYQAFLERNPTGEDAGQTHYNMACTYSTMGMIDKAFEHLEKGIDLGGVNFDWMQKDGDLDALHSDPRWKEMLGKREKKETRRIF